MSGRTSRNKGARGEREVIALLQPVVNRVYEARGKVPPVLKRNYMQRFAAKQYDIDGLPWIALEIKRQERTEGISQWWKQTLASCRNGQVPVLIHRQNHGKWKVRTRLKILIGNRRVKATMDISFDSFLVILEQMIIEYDL